MKQTITVELCTKNHVVFKTGEVAYDKIAEAVNVEYNGKTYGYQSTSKVMTAKFVEVGTPVLLMDKDFKS